MDAGADEFEDMEVGTLVQAAAGASSLSSRVFGGPFFIVLTHSA